MPVLTSPPLVGGAGKPVTGRVAIQATAEYVLADGSPVTTAPQQGVIRDGEFYDRHGNDPLELMPTPEGVGMRIVLEISEHGASRGEHKVSRVVTVPDVPTVAWADLVDVVPPVTGEFVVPVWASTVLTARDEAQDAADVAVNAAAPLVAATDAANTAASNANTAVAGIPAQVASAVTAEDIPGKVAAHTSSQVPPLVADAMAQDATVAQAAVNAMQDAAVQAQLAWVKRDLVAGEDLNAITAPGEYVAAPFSVSSTLLNRWDNGTGVYIVHRQSASGAAAQVIMERLVTASVATGPIPVKRATRSRLFDGSWTPWVADSQVVDDAITAKVPPAKSSATRITAFGDSLTDGGSNGALWPESESWPSRLGVLLGAGYTVTNAGFSGATVGELLIRVGARPVKVIVPAGGIAHNGNATVERVGEYGLSTATRNIDLTYNGKGVRLRASSTGWILDNWTGATIPAGTITLGPAAAYSGLAADTAVVWIGINDITFGTTGAEETVADHIVAGHQLLIEWLSPRVKHVLILGVTPRSNETTGTPANDIVLEVNERLRALYPGRFRSVLKYLQEQAITDMGMTPTQADIDAVAQGVLPPSVLAEGDIGHINQAAAQVVGEKLVRDSLRANGWL